MTVSQIFPDDTLFDEISQAAASAGMYLIGNGYRIVVSPIIPPGWAKIVVKSKRSAKPVHTSALAS